MTTRTTPGVKGGIGTSVLRPDGEPKVTGNFAYASDLSSEDMLWGATLRSPHAHARLVSIDIAPALAMPGVRAVLTQDDVQGEPLFGQEEQDQPVLCDGVARYWGEPVAVVAADDEETARLAAAAIVVEWEPLAPLVDPDKAAEEGSTFRELNIRRGNETVTGSVVVEGFYETATQDQAPLGPEAGFAIPDGEGGLDLYVTSQWIHVDHRQIITCLGMEPDQIRCHPAGIGGAFGSREDISLHIHVAMLSLATGRPVKMTYDRSESFVGHVKRHPSRMWYRHEADENGKLVRVEAKLILDGGAYAHTSRAVIANAGYFVVGPYNCDNVVVEAIAVKTNNPPCGAMRGFGAVQTCFGSEMQMDRLAEALDMDPLELRRRNFLAAGDPLATSGQIIDGSLPTLAVLDAVESIPMPDDRIGDDPLVLPGGTGLTTPASSVIRGVGYAVNIKNLAFSEGFDDFSEARAVMTTTGVEIHTAAMEVGQGLVTVCQQIARTILGTDQVAVVWDDTSQIGSAGSTSASRQTQMTGGAVHAASVGLRDKILAAHGGDQLREDGVYKGDDLVATIAEVCANGPVKHLVQFRHPETFPPDENGLGDIHAGFVVSAHRAVVDVDPELGLVRVVQVDTAQDVGKALNPLAIVGQLEGGTLQGVGLAVMEQLVVDEGVIKNPTFTDYLIPTFVDAPAVNTRIVEEGDHFGPFGAKGIGESPTISATPAVVAAIRAATGRDLTRVPVLPEDIIGI
ncbi:MAG: molybdopterin cofactor-binding domain-containing protein [Actinomycetota bacterium]|nr:molybdopterin cofactor-binding domain-containing protein [Actinomycetota bacterium]